MTCHKVHSPDLVVVIPVYDDDSALLGLLEQLDELTLENRAALQGLEIVRMVVDGAAQQSTATLAAHRATYLCSPAGRGEQIAAGVAECDAQWVWVLHADTRITQQAFSYVLQLVSNGLPGWGRFDVSIDGLGLVAWLMNWRSRFSRICTGDQAMFFAVDLLRAAGGFPAQPLMEDIEVSKRLKRTSGPFHAPRIAVQASARRWQQHGVLRTVLFMWWTRLRYRCGVSAHALYNDYYGKTR